MQTSIFQIDPETLALHINANYVHATERSELYSAIIDPLISGNASKAFAAIKKKKDREFRQEIFLSQYLHEFRHYVDLLLSPYGWYRIRQNLELLSNLPYLATCGLNHLPIPIGLGADAASSKFLGLPDDDFEKLFKMAQPIDSRRRVVESDNQAYFIDPEIGTRAFGGEAILEGLAYLAQTQWIVDVFGAEVDCDYFQTLVRPQPKSALLEQYAWPREMFSFLVDDGRYHIGNELTPTAVFAFLSLCLNGSTLYQRKSFSDLKEKPAHTTSRNVGHVFPSGRLTQLVSQLLDKGFSVRDSGELLEFTLNLHADLWGVGFIEELKFDVEENQRLVEEILTRDVFELPTFKEAANYYRSMLIRRARLVDLVSSDPRLILFPQFLPVLIEKILPPDFIYFFVKPFSEEQSFDFSSVPSNYMGLHDFEEQILATASLQPKKSYSFWQVPHEIYGDKINEEVYGKARIYAYHAPINKYLLHGFRYNAMSDVELMQGKRLVEKICPVLEDPLLSQPNGRVSVDGDMPLLPHSAMLCDFCNVSVKNDTYLIISGLRVRSNKVFWESLKQRVRGNVFKEHGIIADSDFESFFFDAFRSDWSDWCLCRKCGVDFSFDVSLLT